MKYEKPDADIVAFDVSEFMTSSTESAPQNCSGYTDPVGHTCGTYTAGSGCTNWTTPSWNGSCGNYDGKKCYGYTDSTHSYCKEYGVTCAKF